MEKKKILIPIFLILLVGIIACIGIFAGTKKNDTPKTTTTTKVAEKVLTTVILEINPKLALEIDEHDVVVNMYPLNDDAKTLTRENYIGKSLEESVETVLEDTKSYIDKNKKSNRFCS